MTKTTKAKKPRPAPGAKVGSGMLRWIRPPIPGDPTWHLGFSPSIAACGASWIGLRMFSRPLSSGVPERKCIECQDELARMLGVSRV